MKKIIKMNPIKYCYFRLKEKRLNIGVKWDRINPPKDDDFEAHLINIFNPEPSKNNEEGLPTNEYRFAPSDYSNKILRDGYVTEPYREFIEMLNNYSSKEEFVVYRGIPEELFSQMKKDAKNIPGVDLVDKGFMATAAIIDTEFKPKIRLRIKLPKGTNAIYLGNVNNEKEYYYEIRIQCGAQLKIVSIDDTYINCELLRTTPPL